MRRLFFIASLLVGAGSALWAKPAAAQIGSARYSAIVLNARTGEVLTSASPDEARHPASLTKMMTLYMVFEALRDGRLRLDQRIAMTDSAAAMPPSKLGLPVGVSITVEQAILALITKSANDVAALLGETLGGSEYQFAQAMTTRARSLGMSRTTFRNASGLPDIDQITSARDMATLGRRLFIDFPQRYAYFATVHVRMAGVQLRNHNRMLDSYAGADGIKTGFINASGFNIVTSAERDNVRLVGAVFGGESWYARDLHMAALLDQGFAASGVAPRSAVMAARPAPRPAFVARAEAAPALRTVAIRPTAAPPSAAARRAAAPTAAQRRAATRAAAAPQRAAPARQAPAARAAATRPRAVVAPTARAVVPPPRPPRQAAATGRSPAG
ncbi:D-alanyl-D-alanine carboxypeptidase family protein [Humitalea sp. 24SJ18S-53]|uniref:D-alanyl-D-alanine carboxypeptidase family protein n=1 Tax=Humitalea sp. 24SJ18S-53 TaxID=3422307 RepID=UPI003D666762